MVDFKEFSLLFFKNDPNVLPDKREAQEQVAKDPYIQEKTRQQYEAAAQRLDSPVALLNLFKDKLKARGPRGMVGLQRIFKIMDDDQSGSLTQREFSKACKDFKIGISDENIPALFKLFDKSGDGTMSFEEFLGEVRGNMSQKRIDLCLQAYEKIDADNDGDMSIDEIQKSYDASKHPDVKSGKRSE